MGLIDNKVRDIDSVYTTDYPPIGAEPYCGITEEDLNPILSNERVTYYENHLSKKYFDEDSDPIYSSNFDISDGVFIKLQIAQNKVDRINECLADNKLLNQARLDMLNTYVTDDQYRSCLLIPLTVMVTPAMAKDFICAASSEIEKLLVVSEQAMENL